jgi:hypothetical protein
MANIEIENKNMDIEIPSAEANEELVKDIQAKIDKLSLADRQKVMVYLVGSMSKDVRKASKILEKEDAKPKRKSAHLEIHRDWAAFVLAHAQQNGWPAFEVEKVKKDKSVETDRYSESVQKDGKFVFADSQNEKKPKQISSSIAAQLAKFYWRSKENVGTNKALYDEFIANRPVKAESEPVSEAASASASTTSSPKKKKMTDEEKEAKKNAEKAAKDAEKLKKALEREAAKKKKEEEERQKLLAKLESVGKPKSPKKAPAAAVAASPATSAASPSAPSVKRVVAKKTKEAKEEFKDDFVASDPTGEGFDDWSHTDELGNTKMYLRNALNEVAEDQDGDAIIIGKYDPKTNKIIMD